MHIKPTEKAREGSIFDIGVGAEEFLLIPKSEEVPCPWDADVSVHQNKIILEGFLAPGGPSDRATCTCIVPMSAFSKYFYIEVPDYAFDENPDLMEDIVAAGWEKA